MKQYLILLVAFFIFALYLLGPEDLIKSLTSAIIIAIVVRAAFQYTGD